MNLYAYYLNNPIMMGDPSGNFPILAVLIGAVVGGAIGYGIGRATGATGWDLVAWVVGCH